VQPSFVDERLLMNTAIWSIDYLIWNWRPSFHDDFFLGWLITGSYIACAIIAVVFATYLNQMEEKKAFHFWLLISMAMLALGINKQLDLQTLLTEVGRQLANAQDWYDLRRVVQFSFILVLSAASIAAFLWVAIFFRDLHRRFAFAFCGLFFVLSYMIIRAATFHHIDEVIQYDLHGIKMKWVIELAGIYMIIAAGLKDIFASRTKMNR
jgi:hypothetical protein